MLRQADTFYSQLTSESLLQDPHAKQLFSSEIFTAVTFKVNIIISFVDHTVFILLYFRLSVTNIYGKRESHNRGIKRTKFALATVCSDNTNYSKKYRKRSLSPVMIQIYYRDEITHPLGLFLSSQIPVQGTSRIMNSNRIYTQTTRNLNNKF